jgi:hypothetical protein
MIRVFSFLFAGLILSGCATVAEREIANEKQNFSWLEPKGWQNYAFAFPLYLSSEVMHEGHEELRLPPGFFKPESPEFWSYAFAWWLKDTRPVDIETLTEDLPKYYRGLCATDGPKTLKLDPARYRTRVTLDPSARVAPLAKYKNFNAYLAEVDTYECLSEKATGAPMVLKFRIKTFRCEEQNRNVALFAISPKDNLDPIWATLDNLVNQFRCRK